MELRSAIGRWRRNRHRLHHFDPLCYGRDFIAEIPVRLPHHPIRTVFDVGANIGITAMQFADAFPAAAVYAFEPVAENFAAMRSNLIGKPDIKRLNVALGAAKGTALIRVDHEHPSTCNIVAEETELTSEVAVETIDGFCSTENVSEVDILKIDTEGYELPVLEGASRMLREQRVALIKAECAVDPDDNWHTQFGDLCAVLHPLDYRLFGLYEQYECWIKPKPRLRRFDAAFVSRKVFEARGDQTHVTNFRGRR